ncbi:transposase family protein [Streptomyces sp. NPDC058424]|uniref:transposase family protein n=1 Tax=Streptomyces sp. NPDC058424 TaxID=3346491 RepID=UPI0036572675
MTHVVLDGTLIACDRLAGVRENGNDLWFSRKHKSFGGNIQILAAPDGTPLWVSDVEPGSTPGHHRGPYPRHECADQTRVPRSRAVSERPWGRRTGT